MKAIYRTNFEVRGKLSATELTNALAKLSWQWVFDPRRGFVAPSPMPVECVTFLKMPLNGGANVEAVMLEEGNALRWALGFSHPDRTDPDVQWRTEIGVERTTDKKVFFSCSLYLGRTNKSLAPLKRAPTRPRIVLDILKKFDGYGSLPLTSIPLPLNPKKEYIEAFLSLLQDGRRQHPVVYVTTHVQSGKLFFDVNRLAEHLAGTAYVIVSENYESCSMLEQNMPKEFRAFDGAVRLYWPGFSFKSNPFDHPLWTKFRVTSIQTRGRDAFSKRLLGDIAAVTATSLPESLLTWAKIEEIHRRNAIAQAKTAHDKVELLKLYEDDNENLRVIIAGLEKEIQTKGEELYRAQARIAMLENQSELEDSGPKYLPVQTVADAIEQAGSRWKIELIFALNSKSEGDESPFQPASEVLSALEWLATTYYQSKLGKKKVTNFNKDIADNIPGWDFSAHQSDAATGRFKEWYECNWEGRTYSVTDHVGTGISKRPEETIRIAFAWDKGRKIIVIGYIGQHQKNTKS